jgi:hypothetical protein
MSREYGSKTSKLCLESQHMWSYGHTQIYRVELCDGFLVGAVLGWMATMSSGLQTTRSRAAILTALRGRNSNPTLLPREEDRQQRHT